MSILKDHARPAPLGSYTVVTSRIPESQAIAFRRHCDSLNISVSKAIGYLIEEELKRIEAEAEKEAAASSFDPAPIEEKPAPVPKLIPEAAASPGSPPKGWAKQFSIIEAGKEMLPCPVCNGWKSASNFARHVKTAHAYPNAYQFMMDHLAIVEAMIKEKSR